MFEDQDQQQLLLQQKFDSSSSPPQPTAKGDDLIVNWRSVVNSTSGFDSTVSDIGVDIETHLLKALGPRRLEFAHAITMTAVYSAIFVTGVIGNVSTCLVIARCRYMRSATNYYLFNLAVADLLQLILGLPQETYSFWFAYPWPFDETFCVVRTLAAEASTYASILTITAFTVERYVGICHPMRRAFFQTPTSIIGGTTRGNGGSGSSGIIIGGGPATSRAVKAVAGIWLLSIALSGPIVAQYGIVYLPDPSTGLPISESALCSIREDRFARRAFEVATFLFFFAPMTVIIVLYALIWIVIRRRAADLARRGSCDCGGPGAMTHLPLSVVGTRRTAAATPVGRFRHQRQQQQQQQQLQASGSMISTTAATCQTMFDEQSVHHGDNTHHFVRARRVVLKMLVAVVVAFFICWAPFHTQRLLSLYLSEDQMQAPLLNGLFYVSGVLYYVSSVVNPIIYNVMSLKFRQSFRDTILRCRCCPSTPSHRRHYFERSRQGGSFEASICCGCCCRSRHQNSHGTAGTPDVIAAGSGTRSGNGGGSYCSGGGTSGAGGGQGGATSRCASEGGGGGGTRYKAYRFQGKPTSSQSEFGLPVNNREGFRSTEERRWRQKNGSYLLAPSLGGGSAHELMMTSSLPVATENGNRRAASNCGIGFNAASRTEMNDVRQVFYRQNGVPLRDYSGSRVMAVVDDLAISSNSRHSQSAWSMSRPRSPADFSSATQLNVRVYVTTSSSATNIDVGSTRQRVHTQTGRSFCRTIGAGLESLVLSRTRDSKVRTTLVDMNR